MLQVDFGTPTALERFRIWVTYADGARGATWAIEYSSDSTNWTKSADFDYRSSQGGGLNDDGTRRTDYGGWYGIFFNLDNVEARYWRIRQTAVTISHPPRSGQVEFYDAPPAEPVLLFRADDPALATDANGNVTIWHDESGIAENAVVVTTNKGPVRASATINGASKPVIRFDGTQILETPVTQTPFGSLFIVMKTADPNLGNQRVVGWEDSDTGKSGLGLSPQLAGGLFAILRNNGKGGDLFVQGKPNVDYELVTVTWGPDGTALYRNGVLTLSSTNITQISSDPNIRALRIGGPGSGGSPRFKGDILELQVYDTQLSDTVRASVESEIMTRWLTVSGPTLGVALTGGEVIITWEGTAVLQQSDQVNNTGWSDFQGAKSPQHVTPSAAHKFYRLKQ
jgi:hypothetical protein